MSFLSLNISLILSPGSPSALSSPVSSIRCHISKSLPLILRPSPASLLCPHSNTSLSSFPYFLFLLFPSHSLLIPLTSSLFFPQLSPSKSNLVKSSNGMHHKSSAPCGVLTCLDLPPALTQLPAPSSSQHCLSRLSVCHSLLASLPFLVLMSLLSLLPLSSFPSSGFRFYLQLFSGHPHQVLWFKIPFICRWHPNSYL